MLDSHRPRSAEEEASDDTHRRRQAVRAAIVLVCTLVVFAAVPATAAVTTLRAGASDPEGTTAPALAIGKLCELATRLSNGELNVQPFYQSLGALNLFVSTQLAGVRYEEAVRATIPFIVIMMIDLAIMAVFPVIPLMLPHLLFGYPLPR